MPTFLAFHRFGEERIAHEITHERDVQWLLH